MSACSTAHLDKDLKKKKKKSVKESSRSQVYFSDFFFLTK